MIAYEPITVAEARGDSRPMRKACLDLLAGRGADLLSATAHLARPCKPLSAALRLDAWMSTRLAWGGRTIDLSAAQPVLRSSGWAVATGHHHTEISPDASFADFTEAMVTASLRTPAGLYLGVFYDADNDRIDIDTSYLTDNRDDAIAVGVAAHSTGGAYDFATGDALWMPHLINS